MKILKNLLIGLVALIALFIVIGLFLPDQAHVERSIAIDAPPATIFSLVNSFRRFNEWSPWADRNHDTEYVYQGPESGVGAKLSWSSDDRSVGSGSQEIIESEADRMVRTLLDFGEQGTATATLRLEPTDSGTRVTWTLESSFGRNLLQRYFGLFFDSLIGPDYERGLANLKVLAEKVAAEEPVAGDDDVEISQIRPTILVYVTGTTTRDPAEISRAFADAYAMLEIFIEENELTRTGPPRAIVNFLDESGYGYDAAIPVEGDLEATRGSEQVKIRPAYAGRAACSEYVGSYDELGAIHERIEAYMALNDLEPAGKAWEEYVSDPVSTPEAELLTRVCYPVAG